MSFSSSAKKTCFVACHAGPADHFAAFAESLSKRGGSVEVYASGPALKKFQEQGVKVNVPFSLDNLSPQEENTLAEQIAKACSTAAVVITDVGHAFDIKVQKALARHVTHRLAYYDNPESYVPGGYSAVAAEVMLAAEEVLFANSTLAQTPLFQKPGKEIDLGSRKKVGIGYYPLRQAEKIAKRRTTEQLFIRKTLFLRKDWVDTGQKVLVYFGGNNEEYLSKALPAFLSCLEEGMKHADFTHLIILFQQHPGAKSKNLDGNKVTAWMSKHSETPTAPRLALSDFTLDEAQIIADGALYYQTSLGPQFVLAGIPPIQIGHETFPDILVKNQLSPSVTNAAQFIKVIHNLAQPPKEITQKLILKGLGIKLDGLETLYAAIKSYAEKKPKHPVKKSYTFYYVAAGGAVLLIGFLTARFFKSRSADS